MFAVLAVLVTLHLTAKDNFHLFTVKPRTTIVMTLKSNPGTGYAWRYVAPPGGSRVFRLLSHRFVAPKTHRVGAAGKEIFRFRALRPHSAMKLKFVYIQMWRPNMPAQEVGVAIRVRR